MMKRGLGLALGFSLLAGIAWSGDYDYLAMRGGVQDGKTWINAFTTDTPLPCAASQGNRTKYLEWKNTCVPTPLPVFGAPLELPEPEGFELVQPYLATPDPVEEGFLVMLGDALIAKEDD